MEIYKTPIHQLHQKRQTQEISSTQIVESVWQRIEQHQDKLNAYLCLEKKEKLLQKAEQIDEQIQKGAEKIHPLAAMPIGLKDIFITQGLETTAASKILKGFIPPYESTASKKLLDSLLESSIWMNLQWELLMKILPLVLCIIHGIWLECPVVLREEVRLL